VYCTTSFLPTSSSVRLLSSLAEDLDDLDDLDDKEGDRDRDLDRLPEPSLATAA